jgi:hypothetical protein
MPATRPIGIGTPLLAVYRQGQVDDADRNCATFLSLVFFTLRLWANKNL